MSHRLTKREKAQKGGKLARALGLRLSPKTGLYAVGEGMTAEQVFDLAHEAVCEVEAKHPVGESK